ncbi:urokinase plasminogen activator surface receptor [Danio aesculapii]|uniref:urokinase plasminogen activator surface receptor n=1 Tax=Danio aesculapii TaxID=1142201 RepID=UPI0024C00510|nr:urokinase plasminogen activator surface receptor [Danio aesculapii]
MHLQVILLSVLLTGGFSLKCYDCQNSDSGRCGNVTCDRQHTKCASERTENYFGVTKVDLVSKRCVMPIQCVSWSISTACGRKDHSVQCCDNDLCNDQNTPALSPLTPNGRKCFACDWEDCSKTVNCQRNEDYCFSAYSGAETLKGCVTKSVCDKPEIFKRELNKIITCCSGNLCNGAESFIQSFMFLCFSLITVILVH